MNEAELYHRSNNLQRRDAFEIMKEYSGKIKWRRFGKIIDIGCGDGSVTVEILKPFVCVDHFKLIGCDISTKMVNYANYHFKDEHTSFVVQDIADSLQKEMRGSFDHAFSFYALHWIKDQEKAFSNLYDLLDDNGDCLLIFLGHMPMFDVYRKMAESHKWKKLMVNVDRYVSPYHDSQEPEQEVRRMMKKIGFRDVDVQCRKTTFVFDGIDRLKKAVLAVNPFSIPKDLQEEFLEDYVDVVREMRLTDEGNNNEGEEVRVRAHYNLLVTYAKK